MNPCQKNLVLVILLLLSGVTSAQEWARRKLEASPRHLEWVTVPAGQRQVETYVAYPERSDKAPVVLIIHEIFGHTDWIRLTADQLAEAGFIAVAPDLLSGMGPEGGATSAFESVEDTRKAVSSLDPQQVTSDLKAVLTYARAIPAATGEVNVAGFCWGGSQAFRFATNASGLDSVLVFYGSGPEARSELARIVAPVHGFYAENDARVNATVGQTTETMKDLGKPYFPEFYAGGGHGFMRAGQDPEASEGNRQARDKGWARMLQILNSESKTVLHPGPGNLSEGE